MSEQRPWWFSGDETPAEPSPQRPVEPVTDARTPESAQPQLPDDAAPDAQPSDGPGLADVIAGLGTLVGWARERVIDPHLEHTDPAEHPDCVICRGMAVVQRLGEHEQALADEAVETDEITWVPLTRKGRARKTTRNDKRGKGKGAAAWG